MSNHLPTFSKKRERVLTECGLNPINSGIYHGEWASTNGKKTITIHSPINGEEIAEVTTAEKADYDKTIQAAQNAFTTWSAIPAPKRGEAVRRIVDEITNQKKNLGLLVSLEVGKTITESQGEIQEMIDIGHFAQGLSRQLARANTTRLSTWRTRAQ